MRVERIQPEMRQAEGTAKAINTKEEKQLNVQKPSTTPLPPAAKEEEKKKSLINDEETRKALAEKVEQLNKTVEIFDKRIRFLIHEETKRVMVKVIEAGTEEVITEIPPEKILDMMAKIEETLGLLVDKKV